MAALLEHERQVRFEQFGQELPKAWEVIEGSSAGGGGSAELRESVVSEMRPGVGRAGSSASRTRSAGGAGADVDCRVSQSVFEGLSRDVLRGCRRVVIIGVHGWFPGACF